MQDVTGTREGLRAYLSFDVPASEIDSETLGVTLVESNRLLNRIAYYVEPNLQVSVRVSPPQSGSFEIPTEIIVMSAFSLALTAPDLSYLAQMMKILGEYYKLWQILKGNDPKKVPEKTSGDLISIEGDNNTVNDFSNATFNLYVHDGEAKAATERQFQKLEQDSDVRSYSVLDQSREPIVEVAREDFPTLATRRARSAETGDQTTVRKTCLVVKKPVLQEKPASWEFIDDEGRKVKATMTDETFLKSIQSGEEFAMGDRLEVDLQSQLKFNPGLKTHVMGKQEVLRVYRHIKGPEQMDIPNDSDGIAST